MFTIVSDELGVPVKNLGYDSNFRTDLGADSLKMMELSFAIEQEFGIVLLTEELADMSTIKDLQDLISRYIASL